MRKRNVLLIMSDQQQATAMGCVDASYNTPNLDRLAAIGVRYSNLITTSAQCSPSRASLLTGRHPHQVGVNIIGHELDPGDLNVEREFQRHGYQTVYFGKWHLGKQPLQDYGIEISDCSIEGARFEETKGPDYHSYKDEVATVQAVNYLSDMPEDRPFFMTVSFHAPHPMAPKDGPFEWVDKFIDHFPPQEEMPIPRSFYQDDLSTKPPFQLTRSQTGESRLTPELVQRDALKYRTMVSMMDENTGRILDKLEERGLLDNTIILFTSDHGDLQGAHRMRLKGVLPYKELYNVPFLLYVPGEMPMRKVIPDLVSNSAIAGTLLDAAGLPIPENFDGGSVLPLIYTDRESEDQKVYFEHYKAYWGQYPFRAVQTTEWKYIYYYEHDWEEMYDLINDPDEITSIADHSEFAGIKAGFKADVDEWWERTGALLRVPIGTSWM